MTLVGRSGSLKTLSSLETNLIETNRIKPDNNLAANSKDADLLKNIKDTYTTRTSLNPERYSETYKMLMAYPKGHPMIVTYYHRNIGNIDIRSSQADLSDSLHQIHDDLTKINQFEMRLISPLTQEQNEEDRSYTITGEAVTYPGFEPFVGDLFLLNIGDNQIVLFSIDNVTPTTYRQNRYHQLSFNSWAILDSELYDWLIKITKDEVYFDKKKYFGDSELTFLTDNSYRQLEQLRKLHSELRQYYISKFYNSSWESFIRPDNIYDPYVTEFIKKKLTVKDHGIRPLQLYTRLVDFDKTIWYKFLYATDKDTLTDLQKYYHIKFFRADALAVDFNALLNNQYIVLGYDLRDHSKSDSTTDVPVLKRQKEIWSNTIKNYPGKEYILSGQTHEELQKVNLQGLNAYELADYQRVQNGLEPIYINMHNLFTENRQDEKSTYEYYPINTDLAQTHKNETHNHNNQHEYNKNTINHTNEKYTNDTNRINKECINDINCSTHTKLSPIKSVPGLGVGGFTDNKTIGPFNESTYTRHDCNNNNNNNQDIVDIPSDFKYSFPYVLSPNFYLGYTEAMNEIETLTFLYLTKNKLDIDKIIDVASQYRRTDLSTSFYRVPILIELVDAAIQKIT